MSTFASPWMPCIINIWKSGDMWGYIWGDWIFRPRFPDHLLARIEIDWGNINHQINRNYLLDYRMFGRFVWLDSLGEKSSQNGRYEHCLAGIWGFFRNSGTIMHRLIHVAWSHLPVKEFSQSQSVLMTSVIGEANSIWEQTLRLAFIQWRWCWDWGFN